MKKFASQEIKEFLSKPMFDEKVILSKDSSWPKISIVTPSYNQGMFLERTILSVLNQNYPNLEYILIDGGSTDGSVEIIRKYEKYLAYWISEKDNGQSHAINKGFQKSTGDILAYLNSDDTYLKGTLRCVVKYFQKHPGVELIYGNVYFINENDRIIGKWETINYDFDIHLYDSSIIPQSAAFWRRNVFFEIGGFNENLKFAMDGDFWFSLARRGYRFHFVNELFANFRLHDSSKSVRFKKLHKFEAQRVRERILGRPFTNYEKIIKRFCAKLRKKWKRLKLDILKTKGDTIGLELQIWSDKNKKYFDYDAESFADKRWLSSQKARYDYELTKEFLLRSLSAKSNDNILEVGCGPGVWTALISEKCKCLTAVDISDNMIKQAKSRVKMRNVKFLQADFVRYEDTQIYDKLFSVRVIEYLPNLISTVRKISRLVKNNGKVSIITKTAPTLITIRANLWQNLKSILIRKNETSGPSVRYSMKMINPLELRRIFMQFGFKQVDIFPVILRFPLFIHDRYSLPFVNVHYEQIYERILLNLCNGLSRIVRRMPKILRYAFLFFSETYLLEAEKQ